MGWIDADAHVHESARTWSYMEGEDAQFQPISFERVAGAGGIASAGGMSNQLLLFDAPWAMRNPTPMNIGTLMRPGSSGALAEQGIAVGDRVPVAPGAK